MAKWLISTSDTMLDTVKVSDMEDVSYVAYVLK